MTPIFRLFFSMRQLVMYDDFGNVGTLVMPPIEKRRPTNKRRPPPLLSQPIPDLTRHAHASNEILRAY